MTSELEYLERDCEITVFPHPKAPGIAVVPPCTHLKTEKFNHGEGENCLVKSEVGKINKLVGVCAVKTHKKNCLVNYV